MKKSCSFGLFSSYLYIVVTDFLILLPQVWTLGCIYENSLGFCPGKLLIWKDMQGLGVQDLGCRPL